MIDAPRIAILPEDRDDLARDVEAAGGTVASPKEADAIIYTDARDPSALAGVLGGSPARWVQLPFAGIEPFFDAGVIDEEHTWTCAKGIYGGSTAEHALTLLLAAARRIEHYARARTWKADGSERRLKDAVVVIVGTGGIGRALTAMLAPLGARVVGVNRSGARLEGAERTVSSQDLLGVLAGADFVVLAAALTEQTRGLIGRAELDAMSPEAWLVNVGRGGLVDTEALVDALRSRSVGGAALDVTDPEPLPDDHPLWDCNSALITPHIANTWAMALPELRALIRRNIRAFAAGEDLEGLVDPGLGY